MSRERNPIIIIFENGRLGNQLFQYCGLRTRFPDGEFILLGMDEIKSVFDGLDLGKRRAWKSVAARWFRLLGRRRIEALVRRAHVIGTIEERVTKSGIEVQVLEGFLSNAYLCGDVFFQSELLSSERVISSLHVKRELMERARDLMARLPVNGMPAIFVHVRRGDYIRWPSSESPAVLPCRWYREQMATFKAKYADPYFLVMSDDRPYAMEMFGHDDRVYVSHEEEGVDLALMSICQGGILSASSFAWWAAYFAHRNNLTGIFVSPLYWAGHRQGVWLPHAGIRTGWMTYVGVS